MKPKPIQETHFTTNQAIEILGSSSRRFLTECGQLGRIKAFKIGGRWWFDKAAILKARRVGIPPHSMSRDVIRARRKAQGLTRFRRPSGTL